MELVFTHATGTKMQEQERLEVLVFLYSRCQPKVINTAVKILSEIIPNANERLDISSILKENNEIFCREFSSLITTLGYEIVQKDEQYFVSVPT